MCSKTLGLRLCSAILWLVLSNYQCLGIYIKNMWWQSSWLVSALSSSLSGFINIKYLSKNEGEHAMAVSASLWPFFYGFINVPRYMYWKQKLSKWIVCLFFFLALSLDPSISMDISLIFCQQITMKWLCSGFLKRAYPLDHDKQEFFGASKCSPSATCLLFCLCLQKPRTPKLIANIVMVPVKFRIILLCSVLKILLNI